jgi:hypothetical protein
MQNYNSKRWIPKNAIIKNLPMDAIGIFISENDEQSVKITNSDNPKKNASIGFANIFVKVESPEKHIDGTLVLVLNPKNMGTLNYKSLRIFQWNHTRKDFIKMPRSGVGSDGKYLWARITKPGYYAVIGLNDHPRIRAATRTFCASTLTDSNPVFIREVCNSILCPNGRFGDIERTPLPGMDRNRPNDICELCLNIGSVRLPECDLESFVPGHGSDPTPAICSDEWVSMGPTNLSGPIRKMALDPQNQNRIYALSENGGLWVLNDINLYPSDNKKWIPLTDDIECLKMSAFSVAPSDGNVLYIINAISLYRSENRGEDWILRTLPANIRGLDVAKLLVHPNDPNTIFLASRYYGLYRSTNGGTTWEPRLHEGEIHDIIFNPDDPDILYFSRKGYGVYSRSENGGALPVC